MLRSSLKSASKKKQSHPTRRVSTVRGRYYNNRPNLRRAEKKNLDIDVVTQVVAGQSTAVVQLLNAAVQGTSPTTYLGRSFRMRSLFIRWEGSLAATSAGSSPLRMVIIYDKQTNASLPATTTVFSADSLVSPINLANNRRFKVLMDEEIECVGTQGPQSWSIKRYMKLNHITEFNTTNGGTVADITTGGVYAFFWQNGAIITANPSSIFYSRIRFEDE